MPQDLAALLIEEGAVSKADLDRALARQAEAGGALDTALLELGLIEEGHLLSFLAHASGFPVAPLAAFREVAARARRVFPARVAERHRLAPLALDGRELSVVGVHPVDSAAIDEIGFMLSLTLVPHVGVEWRVQELIQQLYGGQLSARLARLAEAAKQEPAPPHAAPAEREAAEHAAASLAQPRAATLSIEEAFFAAGESGRYAAAPGGGAAEPAPEPMGPPTASSGESSFEDLEPPRQPLTGFSRGDDEPAEPLLAALEQAVDAFDVVLEEAAAQVPEPPVGGEPAPIPPAPTPVSEAAAEPRAEAAAPEEGAVEPEPPEPEPAPVLDRAAPPRWTIEDARAALASAHHRDEVVLTALRYTRDFFEFAALFAVTRDAVVGHDGLGIQDDVSSHTRATAIYSADPGVVKTVLDTNAPYLGPVARDSIGTANLLDGLWRGTPRTVLLYPILVGDRAVAVVYADNGDAPVSARRLGDLLLFLSTVGAAFERIIRARKKRRVRSAGRPATPPVAAGPREEPPPSDPAPGWMSPPPAVAPSAEDAPLPPPPPSEPRVASPPADAGAVEAEMGRLLASGADKADHASAIVDLVMDPRPEVAAAAREALVSHRADAAVKPLPERLRRALLSGVGDRPIHAAKALGALRDVESIPLLIQALEGGAPATSAAAAEALARITLQNLGQSAKSWLRWWKENRGRARAEWLFAALASPDRDLRLAASGELRAAGEPPVRYAADMPAAELEAAARAWWLWWSREGKQL